MINGADAKERAHYLAMVQRILALRAMAAPADAPRFFGTFNVMNQVGPGSVLCALTCHEQPARK